MISQDKELLETTLEKQETASFDANSEQFTFDFTTDVDTMWEEYTRNPILKRLVERELALRYEFIQEAERNEFSRYEIIGFLYELNRMEQVIEVSYNEFLDHVGW